MAKNIFVVVLALLLGVVAFLGVRYVNISGEKNRMEQEFKEVKGEIGILEAQLRQEQGALSQLNEEKASLLDVLKGLEGKLAQLRAKNALSQRHIFSLIREIKGLQGDRKTLEGRIVLLERENSQMNAKLNSLPGLKDAIRALKKKIREEKIAQWRQLHLEDTLLDGNLGYLVKDGASTYASRVKIEVKALQ